MLLKFHAVLFCLYEYFKICVLITVAECYVKWAYALKYAMVS